MGSPVGVGNIVVVVLDHNENQKEVGFNNSLTETRTPDALFRVKSDNHFNIRELYNCIATVIAFTPINQRAME